MSVTALHDGSVSGSKILDLFSSLDFPSDSFPSWKTMRSTNPYSTEQREIAHEPVRASVPRITQNKPVIVGYGTGCGNGGEYSAGPPVLIKYMHRMMKQASTCRSTALGGGPKAAI